MFAHEPPQLMLQRYQLLIAVDDYASDDRIRLVLGNSAFI